MKTVLIILLFFACILLIVLIAGLILLRERVGTNETFYSASPEGVYSIATNTKIIITAAI